MNFFKDPKISRIFDIGQSIILLVIVALVSINIIILKNKTSFINATSSNDNLLVKTNNQMSEASEEEQNKNNLESENVAAEENNPEIYVDIKGAIKKPGVYKVDSKAIVNDIITLAGGLKTNASTKYLNLSKKVSNEMVINIYTLSEIAKMNEPPVAVCDCSKIDISKCPNASIVESTNSDNASNETSTKQESSPNEANKLNESNTQVSINTATLEELMTLSGIGESKAQAIIEYRKKNGNFKSLEELMNVSGIGASAFEKIKDHIKL